MRLYKRIGIIGGVSPESTAEFYKHIIHLHQKNYPGKAYPEIFINSVDFEKVRHFQLEKDWESYAAYIQEAIHQLKTAGAEFTVIASNTTHIIFNRLKTDREFPVLHIVDSVLNYATSNGFKQLLLLGTRLTMQSGIYHDRIRDDGLCLEVPEIDEQDIIHRIIFEELVYGKINQSSKEKVKSIIGKLQPDAVILGCTELGLLIKPDDTEIPLIDSMAVHAAATWKYAGM
ncbi:MAG: amino acid racemase [Bacteroidales bacterium]|nr:amino acid racemase [Bacteroidales bacterium]